MENNELTTYAGKTRKIELWAVETIETPTCTIVGRYIETPAGICWEMLNTIDK